jgi:hypothetical protein
MSKFENRSVIPYDEIDNFSKGLTREFIPRAEAENCYNSGQMQQIKQQRHVGAQVTTHENDGPA